MLDLLTRIFYTFFSVAVAVLLVIFLIGTMTAFATEDRECRTFFTVDCVKVTTVSPGDSHIGAQDATQWKKLTVTATANAWKFSPYTYHVDTFHIAEPQTLTATGDVLIEIDEPLSYNRTTPDSFTMTVYLRTDAEGEELYTQIQELSFCGENVSKSLGAISHKMHLFVPYLMLQGAVIDND